MKTRRQLAAASLQSKKLTRSTASAAEKLQTKAAPIRRTRRSTREKKDFADIHNGREEECPAEDKQVQTLGKEAQSTSDSPKSVLHQSTENTMEDQRPESNGSNNDEKTTIGNNKVSNEDYEDMDVATEGVTIEDVYIDNDAGSDTTDRDLMNALVDNEDAAAKATIVEKKNIEEKDTTESYELSAYFDVEKKSASKNAQIENVVDRLKARVNKEKMLKMAKAIKVDNEKKSSDTGSDTEASACQISGEAGSDVKSKNSEDTSTNIIKGGDMIKATKESKESEDTEDTGEKIKNTAKELSTAASPSIAAKEDNEEEDKDSQATAEELDNDVQETPEIVEEGVEEVFVIDDDDELTSVKVENDTEKTNQDICTKIEEVFDMSAKKPAIGKTMEKSPTKVVKIVKEVADGKSSPKTGSSTAVSGASPPANKEMNNNEAGKSGNISSILSGIGVSQEIQPEVRDLLLRLTQARNQNAAASNTSIEAKQPSPASVNSPLHKQLAAPVLIQPTGPIHAQISSNLQAQPPVLASVNGSPTVIGSIQQSNPTAVRRNVVVSNTSASRSHRGNIHLQTTEVEGLPWKTRGLKSLQLLTEMWENKNKNCPHPNCNHNLRTNFQLFGHWYSNHMAPGYCKVYVCTLCQQRYKEKSSFQKHVKFKHNLAATEAEALAAHLEAKWEASVSEDSMLMLLPDESGLPKLNEATEQMFGLNSNTPIFPIPVTKRNYRVVQQPPQASFSPPAAASSSTDVTGNSPLSQAGGGNFQTEVLFGLDKEPMPSSDGIPPKSQPIEGLPWKKRDEQSLKKLALAWVENNYKCPHPECQGQNRSCPVKFNRCSELIKHWFRQHMAPGYCKVYACPCCPTWIKYLQNFRQHLRLTHKLPENVIADMIDQIELKWENLVDHIDSKYKKPSPSSKAPILGSFSLVTPQEQMHSPKQDPPDIKPQMPIDMQDVKKEMEEVLNLEQIAPERQEVPGLPWKGMSKETSEHLASQWEASGKRCPHPYCETALSHRKLMFAHWHQTHLLPGCGIAYPCYGRNEDNVNKACDRVFDNKWDLIAHCREHHRYNDEILQAMFVKIRTIRAKGADPASLLRSGSGHVPDEKEKRADIELTRLMNATLAPENAAKSRRSKRKRSYPVPKTTTLYDIRPLDYQHADAKQSDEGSDDNQVPSPLYVMSTLPQTSSSSASPIFQQSGSPFMTTIKQEYDLAGSTNLIIPKQESGTVPGTSYDINKKSGVTTLPQIASVSSLSSLPTPVTISPDTAAPYNFSSTAAVLFSTSGADPSRGKELPKLLWKAIIAAWKFDKKCPHPSCSGVSGENKLFDTHSQMLGHWLRGHMDQNGGRLYPCLHGKDTSDLCINVYNNADELTSHLLSEHGYNNEEIRQMLNGLKGEWDTMDEQSEAQVNDSGSTVSETPSDAETASPSKRRRIGNPSSPIVLD